MLLALYLQIIQYEMKQRYCNGGASIVTAGRGIETQKGKKLNRFTLSV